MKPTRIAALLLALTLTVAAVGCGGDNEKWEGKAIPLGSLFSTTGDGAPFGPQQLKGAQLAVEEVNKDGIEGAELTLSQRNDESDPATSAKGMKELIDQQGVLAVLGPTFSNSAAEADPVANQSKTPVLAVSNTGPGIVGKCDYPCDFIFRDSLGEATAIPANVNNLVDTQIKAPKTAAVLHAPGDAFGETSAQTATKAFEKGGVKVTQGTTDAPTKVLAAKPQVIMITASSGETGASTVKKLRDSGYRGGIAGGNAFNSPQVARSIGMAGKGVQSAAAWYAGNTSEENQEFISAYREKYGEAPDQFAAQAYTGVKLLAEAADDADLSLDAADLASDRIALKQALANVEEETPLGDFRFTSDHDVSQPIWIVAMDGRGGYELVEKLER